MTQEEKAKRYDEVLEQAKNWYVDAQLDFKKSLETLLPELKESEDERIRKELITHCRNTRCVTEEGAEKIAKWIAWLEKQGEQKPAWSEEDDVMIKVFDSIIRYIVEVVDKDVLERFGTNREELFSWLKSLKQRMGG